MLVVCKLGIYQKKRKERKEIQKPKKERMKKIPNDAIFVSVSRL